MIAPAATRLELSPPPRTVTGHPAASAILITADTSAAEAGCTTQAGRRRAASGKNTRPSAAAYAALPGRLTLPPSASRSRRALSAAGPVTRASRMAVILAFTLLSGVSPPQLSSSFPRFTARAPLPLS